MGSEYKITAIDPYPRSFRDEPDDPIVEYNVQQWHKLLDDFVQLSTTMIVPTMERVIAQASASASVRAEPDMPRVVLETAHGAVYIAPYKGSIRVAHGAQFAQIAVDSLTEALVKSLTEEALAGTLPSHHPVRPQRGR